MEDIGELGLVEDRKIFIILVKDDDEGDNVKIVYIIIKGNEEGLISDFIN